MLARGGAPAPGKVAAYIRWSTDEQGQGTTLAIQRERVELFIRSQGWSLAEDRVFVDDGYSGSTLDRPAMRLLREAVRAGEVDCVVVYKLDRLSRSLLDTVTLVRREWQERCTLYSATENFDTCSPVGQMVFNLLVSFAEFERNLIRERTLSGKRKRAQQGRNAGQRYAYGYRRGDDGGWVLDSVDETGGLAGPAAVVRQIFSRYMAGTSMAAIAAALNQAGHAAPQGGAWGLGAISRVLANPAYAGTYQYGGSQVAGAIPAIVSAEEFAQVQQRRRGRTGRPDRARPGQYLLSGLARCGRCGRPVAGSRGRGRRYYVCTGRRACGCAYMDAGALEAALLAEVRAVAPVGDVAAEAQACLAGAREALARAGADRASVARRRRRLEDEFLGGTLDAAEYARLAARLDAEAGEVAQRLERAAAAVAEAEAVVQAGVGVDPWPWLSFDEVRQVVRELTASLQVYQAPGGAAELVWQPRGRG
jgi:site-specific DNA recombinase